MARCVTRMKVARRAALEIYRASQEHNHQPSPKRPLSEPRVGRQCVLQGQSWSGRWHRRRRTHDKIRRESHVSGPAAACQPLCEQPGVLSLTPVRASQKSKRIYGCKANVSQGPPQALHAHVGGARCGRGYTRQGHPDAFASAQGCSKVPARADVRCSHVRLQIMQYMGSGVCTATSHCWLLAPRPTAPCLSVDSTCQLLLKRPPEATAA